MALSGCPLIEAQKIFVHEHNLANLEKYRNLLEANKNIGIIGNIGVGTLHYVECQLGVND